MALATRCPACSTVFRISTAQAAAKGGMVRCGHCRNVFNSLDALVRVEDLEIVDESSVAGADEPVAAVPPPIADAPVDASGAGNASDASDASGASDATDAPAPAAGNGLGYTEVSGVLASLSGPTQEESPIHEWWMPDRASMPTLPPSRPEADAAIEPAVTGEREGALYTERTTDAWTSGAGATGAVYMQPPVVVDPSRAALRWTWAALSLIAALVLVVQAGYLWRDEIAVRWSPARHWLLAGCAVLDCRVDHPARADAITIESASVQGAAPGASPAANPAANQYVLTALLRNRDDVDVRYPFLDLILTDTNDRVVLRRVLRPEDYTLPSRATDGLATPGFPAQSELPIRVTFELNNLRFAGYRLDKFYP